MKKKRGFMLVVLLAGLFLFTGCYLKNNSLDILRGLKNRYNEKFIIVEKPEERDGYFKVAPKKNPEVVFEAQYRFSGDGSVIPKFKTRLSDNYYSVLLESYMKWLQAEYPDVDLSIDESNRITIPVDSYKDIATVYDILQSSEKSGLFPTPFKNGLFSAVFDKKDKWFFVSIEFFDGSQLMVDEFIENSDYDGFYNTVFPAFLRIERILDRDLSTIPAKDVARYPADYLARVTLDEQLGKQISTKRANFFWLRFDDDGACYIRKTDLIDMLHTFKIEVFFEQGREATALLYSNDELSVRDSEGKLFAVSEATTLTWSYRNNTMTLYPLTGEIQKNGQHYLTEALEIVDSQVYYQGYTLKNIAEILELEIDFDKHTGALSIQE